MSRVLVSGANGFIGRRALAPLARAGLEVHAVSRRPPPEDEQGDQQGASWHAADLLDDGERRSLLQRVEPSHLLHLAWHSEPGTYWVARENADWVDATQRLLDEFIEVGGQRATIAGTCAEYDWAAPQPLGEDSSLKPSSFYGVCKDAARRVAEELAARSGISLSWARLFFLYGPGEERGRLVAMAARSLLAGRRARVSDGTQVRDYMHVDDAAGALVALLVTDVTGPVNVAAGNPVAVRAILELVGAAVGRPELLDFGALPARPDDPPVISARVERLRGEVGFVPDIPLEAGIEKAVSWWRSRLAL
jgi:nucleoside-diphosphate-sugar epimerase